MRSRAIAVAATLGVTLLIPAPAFAAGVGKVVVPEWLSIATVGFGLAMAVVLLVGSIMLKEVSSGSSIADNMTYIMSGALCIAASMLARWVVLFIPSASSPELITLASDLLLTAGMALFSVYFFRVRASLMAFMKVMKQAASDTEGS